MNQRPARAADVAARAGVSVTAVSFVLGGKADGNIAAATRDRILAAAAELGYRPNRVAQSLRANRTHALGLMTDGIASSPFAGRLLAAAGRRAAELGQVLIVHDSHFDTERDQHTADDLAARRVDAIIYATMGLRRVDALPTTSLPLVLANCFQDEDVRPTGIPDEESVGRQAAHLLIEAGHRRVVMLSGQGVGDSHDPYRGNVAGPLRAKAFLTGLRACEIARRAGEVVVAGWGIRDGHAGALRVLLDGNGRLLAARDRPTAIFAVNDRVAVGAVMGAMSVGLCVPEDLSVVGVDDQEELADQLVPALTTFRLPHVEMGVWAVDAAQSLIDPGRGAGPVEPGRTLLPFHLVRRATVGPPNPVAGT
ncbi:MAG: LacI family DNA-binding transcriptional regulator [Dermatophilaceae bacterium]